MEIEVVVKELAGQVENMAKAVNTLLQTNSVNVGATQVSSQDRMGDIGGTERLEKDNMNESGLLFANKKRTYDEYQQLSLDNIRELRADVAKLRSDAQVNDNTQRIIANQALQNAVETANLVSKQAVRHTDIAVDRQWNLDEHNLYVTEILRSAVFKDAVAAEVAKASK